MFYTTDSVDDVYFDSIATVNLLCIFETNTYVNTKALIMALQQPFGDVNKSKQIMNHCSWSS